MSDERNSCGLEEWRSFARPFFDVIPAGNAETFHAHATSTKLGPLVVSDVGFDAAIFDRDPGKLHDFDTEFLLLETYDRGTNRGRSGDTDTELGTNAVHVFDMAQPWRTVTTDASCRSVVIPYSVTGYDPGRHPAYARLDANSPRNAMLLAGMGALFDAGSHVDAEEAVALAESFCALVLRLMFNQHDGAGCAYRHEGQGRFLKKFIDDRLTEPDLGPRRLCEAFGISRAALYRMFPEDGGIRGYITARRLDRCFDELRRRPPRRGSVRAVAERWGFFNAKSFNRAFRDRYGIAPSDCLAEPLAAAADTAAHSINDWMRRT